MVDKFDKFVNVLALLTEREIEIIEYRFIRRRTLEEIAERFSLTIERIRQLIAKVEKLINEEL